MITGAQATTTRSRLYRGGWLVVLLAIASYLLVAVSEQGSVGAGLTDVPVQPVPFSLHQGIGVDLSNMSSLAALEWLEQGDESAAPLLYLPVDGDIVAAFNDAETFAQARSAIDSLVAASDDTPVALCLHKPVSAIDEAVLAEAIVTVLVDDFTDSVAYISTCPGETSSTWQGAILDLLGVDESPADGERILAPVSVGATIRVPGSVDPDGLSAAYLDRLAGPLYVALTLTDQSPFDAPLRQKLRDIVNDRAHIALIFARPQADVSPADFLATVAYDPTSIPELSEGYNGVGTTRVSRQGDWIPTQIGPVVYARSLTAGSSMTAEFIGTEVWAVGLVSPEAGSIGVWIDRENNDPTVNPDAVVDLAQLQAKDTAVLLVDHLPAARHTVTIVTSDGDVTLAGLFVTGRPEAGWHGGLGSLGLIVLAVTALAVVISVAVDDLRLRIGLDRNDEEADHPRVFRREL